MTKVLVFNSHMSVLVNGSPTKEFVVTRGLRQGDPLSPFLFVLVAEGLAGLVRSASLLGNFRGMNINGLCRVDLLQYADDTILVGDGSWQHIWALKVVLRGFEIASGLGVNYHKSSLIGINSNPHFLGAAANFLVCKVENRNFTFLGILIGGNPRRIAFGSRWSLN